MILMRMTMSLKRQDWTMVFIEFVLVVVGVLLGFQINEWANRQADEQASREAMERLLDEAERDVAYMKLAVGNAEEIVGDLHFTIDRLAEDAWTVDDKARMERGLAKGRYMVSLAPPVSVYDDVVASGALNRFDDPVVRQKISEFQSTLTFEERARFRFEQWVGQYERNAAIAYRSDPAGREAAKIVVDFPALAGDPDGRKAVSLVAENHRILLMLRRRALKDSEEMCVALGAALGRRCNLDRVAPTFD
ncbi:hypothetical protein G7076_00985 [Sphingomonas sp. HDW15A]|uniref:hypothetical protein n=1 Tax=Sphingomonas sp. HDW15A TaxID=2714942 RepID=UPI0014099A33|nr:hypothetical protein [Sphingomonas sp. HDW15A]QIK95249.1 hypothetical protein G7076_00985 [Sphingomonas sp. HDW15A]